MPATRSSRICPSGVQLLDRPRVGDERGTRASRSRRRCRRRLTSCSCWWVEPGSLGSGLAAGASNLRTVLRCGLRARYRRHGREGDAYERTRHHQHWSNRLCGSHVRRTSRSRFRRARLSSSTDIAAAPSVAAGLEGFSPSVVGHSAACAVGGAQPLPAGERLMLFSVPGIMFPRGAQLRLPPGSIQIRVKDDGQVELDPVSPELRVEM